MVGKKIHNGEAKFQHPKRENTLTRTSILESFLDVAADKDARKPPGVLRARTHDGRSRGEGEV